MSMNHDSNKQSVVFTSKDAIWDTWNFASSGAIGAIGIVIGAFCF
jgi:hypothetical protein